MRVRGNMSVNGKVSLSKLILCTVLISSTFNFVFSGQSAYAAQITARSLTLQAGGTDGGSKPGGVVNHKFDFNLPTTGNIGSIKFEYCTNASTTCVMPVGLVTTSATVTNQTGVTGFTLTNTTNGAPFLTKAA